MTPDPKIPFAGPIITKHDYIRKHFLEYDHREQTRWNLSDVDDAATLLMELQELEWRYHHIAMLKYRNHKYKEYHHYFGMYWSLKSTINILFPWRSCNSDNIFVDTDGILRVACSNQHTTGTSDRDDGGPTEMKTIRSIIRPKVYRILRFVGSSLDKFMDVAISTSALMCVLVITSPYWIPAVVIAWFEERPIKEAAAQAIEKAF